MPGRGLQQQAEQRALTVSLKVLPAAVCCCLHCTHTYTQGALRLRQQALKSREEEEAAAAASSYRRVEASGNTANAPLPVR